MGLDLLEIAITTVNTQGSDFWAAATGQILSCCYSYTSTLHIAYFLLHTHTHWRQMRFSFFAVSWNVINIRLLHWYSCELAISYSHSSLAHMVTSSFMVLRGFVWKYFCRCCSPVSTFSFIRSHISGLSICFDKLQRKC